MVNLWTAHSPDFDICSGKVDHSKSEYYNMPGFKEAYHELWDRLNIPDEQIIWCYTEIEKDGPPKTGIMKKLWHLSVPEDKIIKYLDSLVWNRILGRKCHVSPSMRKKWLKEANSLEVDIQEYEDKCYEEFWSREPETGSWWDELFVEEGGECINALINHPVKREYIVKEPEEWVFKPREL